MSMIIAKSDIAAGAYVPTSAVIMALRFDDGMLHVSLADGRIISVPIAWFPRLRDASREQLENYEISPAGFGIHWPDVDEDLSVAGFLAGVDPAGI